MSQTYTPYPRYTAVNTAGTKWVTVNKKQDTFLTTLNLCKPDLENLPEIETRVSKDIAELNSFLKENGFDIQLTDMPDTQFGVVSILTLLLQWIKEGSKTTIVTEDEKEYKGFMLKDNFEVYSYLGKDVLRIATKNGDWVYITIPDNPEHLLAEIYGKANFFKENLYKIRNISVDKIRIPNVDLNVSEDISFLCGMKATEGIGTGLFIGEALQQTMMKMDETGVTVKSAVAIGMRKCMMEEKIITIDKPFYMWIERPNFKYPLFAAYITQNDWK